MPTPLDYPPTPGLALTVTDATASISVQAYNPVPEPGETGTVSNDIYRRTSPSDAVGIRLATSLPPNTSWADYTPFSGVDYGYRVVAFASNGHASSSGWLDTTSTDAADAFPALTRFPSLTVFPGV